ncbi:MAG TPA: hypothetical protein DCS83_08075 [Prevotella sp.]|nr:hypothetical protein [Prevotella sp.]
MPSHHLFGIHQMIEKYAVDGTFATIKKEFGGGQVDFFNVNSPKDIIKIYLKSWRYDVIYDSLNVVSKYFSVLNKYHLLHSNLISIYHHPPFTKIMKYGRSNVSVFFSDRLLAEAQKDVSDNRIMVANYWYPDKSWYISNSNYQIVKSRDFMDNGKTGRDHDTFVAALRMAHASGVMVCNESQRDQYKANNADIEFFCQKHPNDLKVLPYINKCKVMVVPLDSTNRLMGPIGNTSYMDAIATGMPIICSNNASFADEIKNNNLGTTYCPRDVNSLYEAMKETIENYEFYHNNMIEFSNTHTINDYANNLIPLILRKTNL